MRSVGPELARRWLAALLVVPSEQREALVAEVERRVVAAHGRATTAAAEAKRGEPVVYVRGAAAQRDGFVEEVETSYATVEAKPLRKAAKRRRA